MRENLKVESEVFGICNITGLETNAVIGSLYLVWIWADGQTTDGSIPFVTAQQVDKVAEHEGFADAMCKVGWLELTEDGAVFPNFENHMSESAKKRDQEAKRKRKQRDKKTGHCPGVGGTMSHLKTGQERDQRREEKRREELIKEKEQKKSSDTQSGDCSPSLPKQEQLDSLIDSWNQLPESIAPRVEKRNSEPITKGWRKVQRTPALKEAFADIPHLMAKIRDGTFLHGQKWFRLPWLFGKKNSEWNVLKILEGCYVGNENKNRDPARVRSSSDSHELFK